MNPITAESILDNHPRLKALPVNARRKEKSYASGYETPSGRHLVLERRKTASHVRLFVENSLAMEEVGISAQSMVDRYGPERPRVDLGRASRRLIGPKDGVDGTDVLCFRLASEQDLMSVLNAYLLT